MPVTTGVTTCAVCQTLVTDDEVKAASVYYCAVCQDQPHYHFGCLGGGHDATCPTCGSTVTVADFDAWGPDDTAAQVIDNSQWQDEDRPNLQVPGSWEDIVDRPQQRDDWEDGLYKFLAAPPTASEWEYIGYQNSGHELVWKGSSPAAFGIGEVEVHFHVHFTGKVYDGQPQWTYGGAWVVGVRRMSIDVEQTHALQGPLLPVVQQHWATMVETERTMQSRRDEERGSWRRNNNNNNNT
jgi:hypothetical protein